MDRRRVIKRVALKQPVKLGKETVVEELEFGEPTVGDLLAYRGAQSGSYAEEVAILASLSGKDEAVITRLCLEDYAECREVCAVISIQLDHGMSYEEAEKALSAAREELNQRLGQSELAKEAAEGEPIAGGKDAASEPEGWQEIL